MRSSTVFLLAFFIFWSGLGIFGEKAKASIQCPSVISGSEISIPNSSVQSLSVSGLCDLVLAGASPGNDAVLYNFANGHEVRRFHLGDDSSVDFVRLSNDGHYALTVSAKGSYSDVVWLWDVSSGHALAGLGRTRTHLALFDPQSRFAVIPSGNDVRFYDLKTLRPAGRLTAQQPVYTLALSVDGTQLATGEKDGTVELWDLKQSKVVSTIAGTGVLAAAVSFSPTTGSLLVITDHVRLFDVKGPKPVLSRELGLGVEPNSLVNGSISPDGSKVLVALSGRVTIYDANSGEELWMGGAQGLNQAEFSPDSHWVLGAVDGSVVRWRISDNP